MRLILAVFGVGVALGPLTTVPAGTAALRVAHDFFPLFQPGVTYTALLIFTENDRDGNPIREMASHSFTINVAALPPPPPAVVLRVPVGVNLDNPGDVADDLIRSGNLQPFLGAMSPNFHDDIRFNLGLWANIWTNNVSFMTFSEADVLFLLNQVPVPLPFEQIDILVANAVLNI